MGEGWLFGRTPFHTRFDRSTLTDQQRVFLSPIFIQLVSHCDGRIFQNILHFCRSERVWILIEWGPPAEQLVWRGISQTVPRDLLLPLSVLPGSTVVRSPPQSSLSMFSYHTIGRVLLNCWSSLSFPFVGKSVHRIFGCRDFSMNTGNCSFLAQFHVTAPEKSYSLIFG